jgi:N-acetylmuramoyl-L-alanine amidase
VIYLDGTIVPGRPEERPGAHTKGENMNSIGVCYVGGVEEDGKTSKDTRTPEQKASLAALLLELKAVYCDAVVHGHRDFSNKACPSFDATEEYAWISSYYDEEEV